MERQSHTQPQAQTIHSIVVRFDTGASDHDLAYLPVADALVLEVGTGTDSGVMLYRYTVDGVFCGDTWHETVDDAKDQAAYEYGDALEEWREIPLSVENAIGYALDQVRASTA